MFVKLSLNFISLSLIWRNAVLSLGALTFKFWPLGASLLLDLEVKASLLVGVGVAFKFRILVRSLGIDKVSYICGLILIKLSSC